MPVQPLGGDSLTPPPQVISHRWRDTSRASLSTVTLNCKTIHKNTSSLYMLHYIKLHSSTALMQKQLKTQIRKELDMKLCENIRRTKQKPVEQHVSLILHNNAFLFSRHLRGKCASSALCTTFRLMTQ